MKISDIMTSKPHILEENATVSHAAKKMKQWNCGILPIGEPHNIVGVITDRDIVTRVVAENKDLKKTLVKDIMTPKPFFCEESDFLQAAIHTMNQHNTRRVLITNKNKALSGILSLGDIIRRVQDKSLLGQLFKETEVA